MSFRRQDSAQRFRQHSSHATRRLAVELLEERRLMAVVAADYSAVGNEFLVNTTTAGGQNSPAIAFEEDGDFIITWAGRTSPSSYGIFAQRYASSGATVGSEIVVNTTTNRNAVAPSVAFDDDGEFVIAWFSYDEFFLEPDVYARRFNAAAVPQGEGFRVNDYTTDYQTYPRVAMDADGDFTIVWFGNGSDGPNSNIYAQRYNAAGNVVGSNFRINDVTDGFYTLPSIAMSESGEFVVAYGISVNPGEGNVFAKRFEASGAPIGSEFKLNTSLSGSNAAVDVAMDADGNFVATWITAGFPVNNQNEVAARRYDAVGQPLGSEFRVNTYTTNYQTDVRIAMDDDGDFVIAWTSNEQDGELPGVFAQAFAPNGDFRGDERQVNTWTTGFQSSPHVAMDPDGDFVITWRSGEQDGDAYGVYAQRYDADFATATAPEIEVRGNATVISSGDTTPSSADFTDFGTVDAASGNITRSFTISNTGDAALTLSGTPRVAVSGANAGDFTVSLQPAGSVPAGGNATFTVVFDPSAVGPRNATISIASDDSDEGSYTFSIRGEGQAAAAVNSFAFDFNHTTSPTQAGATGVLANTLYSGGLGYGWNSAVGSFDRGAIAGTPASDALRDGQFFSRTGTSNNGAKTFSVDVPDGVYWVNVTMGDKIIARDQMQVNAEGGSPELTGLASAVGQFVQRGFSVGVTGGTLDLEFSDLGGANADWNVCAVEIRPLAEVSGVLTLASPGSLLADGLTVTTFNGTGAAPNSLVTIRTSAGTITSSDASPLYQGHQALADASGNYTVSVQAPASPGNVMITAEQIDGRRQTSLSQAYVLATSRRFDFNASAAAGGSNITAPGFTGLLAATAYTAASGFGWISTSGIGEFQRATPTAALSSPLRRDGHFGSGAAGNTFQVAVKPGVEYNVRVFVGDYLIARSNIVVSVEGATPYTIGSLAAGSFDTRLTSPTSTATGLAATADGLLTINLKQASGGTWVANGFDIWEVGSPDPGASALLQVVEPAAGASSDAALAADALAPIVHEAAARWAATGLSPVQIQALESTQFEIVDLGQNSRELGNARPGLIQIDDNAAGYGWFVDSTPEHDEEFPLTLATNELQASSGRAVSRVDLLTLVMHEMGHILGLEDVDAASDPHNLMTENISVGIRRKPADGQASAAMPALAPISGSTDASHVTQESVATSPDLEASPFIPASTRSVSVPASAALRSSRGRRLRLQEPEVKGTGVDL